MKAVFEHIESYKKDSIHLRHLILDNFDAPFHYHPEYELTYISKGKGIRYVGMKSEEFKEGDFVLLGPNLPHCWINESTQENEKVEAYVIQFQGEMFENTFMKLSEFGPLANLFQDAKAGIVFSAENPEDLIFKVFRETGGNRFLSFIDLLLKLHNTNQRYILDFMSLQANDQKRFEKVFSFIINNFKNQISLEDVAEIAMLSPSSFCRYFKKTTGKTLFEILLNYRLEAAAQMLQSSNKRINEIAFESGFEDIPYFNRSFKKWKGVNPKEWRKNVFKPNETY